MTEPDAAFILGVERDKVERFLLLLRDNYRKTEEATFFLEAGEGVGNVHGFANLRDALSHFAEALDPKTSNEERGNHLVRAEEHFRRAIVGPYNEAFRYRTNEFHKLYEQYRREVLPRTNKNPELASAPNIVSIDSILCRIASLSKIGRDIKGKSFEYENWDKGIDGLIDAHRELRKLCLTLEQYLNLCRQLQKERRQTRWAVWGFVATIWSLIATLAALVLAIPQFMR